MPGEPGEMEAMRGAFLGWESQGLQHEVIVMASCCKKGGGQKGNNCHRQVYTQQCLWYCITVLRRDWVVVAGADLRLSLLICMSLQNRYVHRLTTVQGSHLHSSASACAFTTTERAFLPCALIQMECIRWCLKCSCLLHPRLFRGVTPNRHNGELQLRA